MIEELTPQLLAYALLLLLLAAAPLTWGLSSLLLWRYRRAVLRAMATAATGAVPVMAALSATPAGRPALADDGDALLACLAGAPRAVAWRVLCGAAAYALTLAGAAVLAFDASIVTFALVFWAGLWPAVPALALSAPSPWTLSAAALLAWLLPLAGVVAAGWLGPAPEPMYGGIAASIRGAWSPPELLRVGLAVNAAPTLLLLLFMNRHTRAVAPLLLGFVSLLLAAVLVLLLWLASRPAAAWLDAAVRFTALPGSALVAAVVLAGAALGAAGGALLLRRLRIGYLRKRLNDRSATLDTVGLVFAVFHGLLFALAGLAWVLAAMLAFAAWCIGWRLAAHQAPPAGAHDLVFLRVFSLGRRSEQLFDALARHWRHAGSVQLITGPDLLRHTVQPHQWLDFVAGRLARHFVADAASLERAIAGIDRQPDSDGLHRINALFCHANTWEAALLRLVDAGGAVLMDLRRFGPDNAGCITELRHLVQRVPLARCVWIVDRSTDHAFLQQTLDQVWSTLSLDSPNHGRDAGSAPVHELGRGAAGRRALLARLARATTARA